MSAPFGIDLGNNTSVIGVARNRGIDVIVNEVSNRNTPSLVGFGPKSRYLGETAKSNETSNLKNTVGSLKRLLGRSGSDPAVQAEQVYNNALLVNVDGQAGVQVQYQGEQKTFTAVQLTAMYLAKLKQTVETEVKAPVADMVLAVPLWYTEAQRRAAVDAAVIAGLNPVRIINDVTAAAVGYGVVKTDFVDDEVKKVAIVDVGHSSYTVMIGAFKRGELKVLGAAADPTFGGRVLDLAIANYFADEFKDKYKIDVKSNGKAFYRVLAQAEKLKKILSANSSAPFNIESLMEDRDVSSVLKREQLEEFLAPHLERMSVAAEAALTMAGLSAADLDAVEVIGGSSRVPAVKEKLTALFGGKQLSFTLNQDEAIARGAAIVCAVHSPTVRVRPYKFEDVNLHSVSFSWAKVPGEDTSEMEVFARGANFPSTKVITLFRSEDFDLEAAYTHPESLEPGIKPWVGKWTIKGVRPSSTNEPVAVKVKLRQDGSGFYTVDSAYTAEEVTVEEPVEEGAAADEKEPKSTKTVKKWVKKDDLHIVASTLALDEAQRQAYLEAEAHMASSDKLVADTEERKNALEEYIYEIRAKVDDQYKDFASEDEKEAIRKLSLATEDWLYDEGEDASKGQYVEKYEELAKLGNVVRDRYMAKVEEERAAQRAKEEAEAKAKADAEAKAKAEVEAKAREEALAKAKAEAEARARAGVDENNADTNSEDAEGDVNMEK